MYYDLPLSSSNSHPSVNDGGRVSWAEHYLVCPLEMGMDAQKASNTSVQGEMPIPFALALLSGGEMLERSPKDQDPNSCSF